MGKNQFSLESFACNFGHVYKFAKKFSIIIGFSPKRARICCLVSSHSNFSEIYAKISINFIIFFQKIAKFDFTFSKKIGNFLLFFFNFGTFCVWKVLNIFYFFNLTSTPIAPRLRPIREIIYCLRFRQEVHTAWITRIP